MTGIVTITEVITEECSVMTEVQTLCTFKKQEKLM